MIKTNVMKLTFLRFISENMTLLDENAIHSLMPVLLQTLVTISNEKEYTTCEYCHGIIKYILVNFSHPQKAPSPMAVTP